jgi:L-amino acid N-acyltransferase YncA
MHAAMENADAQPISIEPLAAADWEAVRAIYLERIRTGNATFETSVPDWMPGMPPTCALAASCCAQTGFRVVGTREKIGSMEGRCRDVLLLERRSRAAGV